MGSTTRLRMMIVMIALAEPKDPDPKVVSAMIGCIEAAISESGHMADRIDRPSHVIDDQHRHVEAPQHPGKSKCEVQRQRQSKMRQYIEPGVFPQTAIPNFTYVGGVPLRALAKFSWLSDQPHHVGIGKAVHRTVNIFVRIGFEMMVTVIPHPRDWIACKRHGGAGCEYKLEPFRHFEAAMSQVPVEIKRRANSAPKKEQKHDRHIRKVEARQESDHPEQLERDQDDENEKVKFFVFKHAARWSEDEAANRAAVKSRGQSIA